MALPRAAGLEPSYSQNTFDATQRNGQWQLVASPNGEAGSLTIQTDARIYLANLPTNGTLAFEFAPGRHGWLQVLHGAVNLHGEWLQTSDAAAISDEPRMSLRTTAAAEVMLFDLA